MKARRVIEELIDFISIYDGDAEVYVVSDGKLCDPLFDIVDQFDDSLMSFEMTPEDLGIKGENVLLIVPLGAEDDEDDPT